MRYGKKNKFSLLSIMAKVKLSGMSLKRANRLLRKRFNKRKRALVNVNRALSPFAQRYITKMKYSEAYTLSALNAYTQMMRINGIWDPNTTGVGHQPYGFDQLTPIYNRYRVISCSYVINAYSGTNPIRFGCLPCNDTPPIGGASELCENPRAKFRIQLPNGSTQTITGKVSLPSLMGRNKAQYMADDRFQSEVTTNPLEVALLYITGQSMTDSSVDILLNVTLEYTVEFFDPKPIDQS